MDNASAFASGTKAGIRRSRRSLLVTLRKNQQQFWSCPKIVFAKYSGFPQKFRKFRARHAQCLMEFVGGKQLFGWVGQGLFVVEEHDARLSGLPANQIAKQEVKFGCGRTGQCAGE
jgi:hypothetical protein